MVAKEILKQFLLVYDTSSGRVEIDDLGEDLVGAAQAYAEREQLLDAKRYEVVLIGADSLDTIHVTHAHYFEREEGNGGSLRSKLLAAALTG